ncbi:MAG TPA: hypothetical protein VGM36_04330 [Rhizomicrobium sp.]|jgi:hypothetical protein
MIRIALAAATAAILFAAAPASAQTGMMGGGMSSENTSDMSCADMMTKAKTMSTPQDKTKAMMAQNEMKMAQTAQTGNDEATCKMHMKKAMASMM